MILTQWDEGVAIGSPTSGRWHQTPPGRVFAGLLLSLGLSYGLLQLGAAVIAVWAQETGADRLPAILGWGLLLGLQGLGVLAGGCMGAVGARQGKTYGSIIALFSSGIALYAVQSGAYTFLAAPYLGPLNVDAGETLQIEQLPLGKKLWYVLPAFYVLCGAAGGAVGSRIWRIPEGLLVPKFEPLDNEPFQELKTGAAYRPSEAAGAASPWAGPVAWGRVLLGIGVACAISLAHKKIILGIVILAEGYIRVHDNAQEALASREIFALAIMLGGCVAGATRANGLKQGLLVGIVAGAVQAMIALRAGYPNDQLFYIMLGALFLAPVGGWFGSGLIPPATPRREILREPL